MSEMGCEYDLFRVVVLTHRELQQSVYSSWRISLGFVASQRSCLDIFVAACWQRCRGGWQRSMATVKTQPGTKLSRCSCKTRSSLVSLSNWSTYKWVAIIAKDHHRHPIPLHRLSPLLQLLPLLATTARRHLLVLAPTITHPSISLNWRSWGVRCSIRYLLAAFHVHIWHLH